MTTGAERHRVAFLGTLYPGYVEQFYARRPELGGLSFAEQESKLADDFFGWGFSFPKALSDLGHETTYIIANARPLQTRWASENKRDYSESDWLMDLVIARLQAFEPDTLYINDIFAFTPERVSRIRRAVPSVKKLICYVGVGIEGKEIVPECDMLVTCAPDLCDGLKKMGFHSAVQRHAFHSEILKSLEKNGRSGSRGEIEASFVGSLIPGFHKQRFETVHHLCRATPIQVWTGSVERNWFSLMKRGVAAGFRGKLREFVYQDLNLPIRSRQRSELFGMEMLETLWRSKVTVNCHVVSSGRDAGNIRMFEATGVGACLLTDWRDHISDIFEPEKEVVTYRSPEEAAEKLLWLLENPKERQAIAQAGQARVLREHTFERRAADVNEWITELHA